MKRLNLIFGWALAMVMIALVAMQLTERWPIRFVIWLGLMGALFLVIRPKLPLDDA